MARPLGNGMEVLRYRAEFPVTRHCTYLNHAAFSPGSARVIEAVQDFFARAQEDPGEQFLYGLFAMEAEVKALAAHLMGAARPDEIALVAGTAVGINTAANSLPLAPGDNVLVVDGDYPANIYPWLNLAPRGVLTKFVPSKDGGVDLDLLESRIDRRTRAVALSSAMFATGFKCDLAAVGALCRQRDLFFVVDAIQTLGAFPLDVQACSIDFLACSAYKWLLGVPGIGMLYCRHETLGRLQPGAYVGAESVVDPFAYLDYNFTLQDSAERFATGMPNFVGIAGLRAALGLLLEIGVEQIGERILQVTDVLIADLQERGYRVLSNLERPHRSGIVLVEVPRPQEAQARLEESKVVTSLRGAGLRVSPHFYNTEDEVRRVGAVLDG